MAHHRPGDWIHSALCAEIGIGVEFFPNQGDTGAAAKAVCRSCDVQAECLEYAVTAPSPLQGIWGGLSSTERRVLRGRRGVRDVADGQDGGVR